MNYLEEFIDTKNSSYVHQRDHRIKTLRDLKEVWNKSPDGGRLLQRKSGKMKRLDASSILMKQRGQTKLPKETH